MNIYEHIVRLLRKKARISRLFEVYIVNEFHFCVRYCLFEEIFEDKTKDEFSHKPT